MTIDVNKKYMLTGGQIEDLASRLALTGEEVADKAEKAQTGSTAPTTSTPGEIGQLYIQSDGTVYILKNIVEQSGQPDEYTWEKVGGGIYTAGDGIDITNDVVSATNTGKARVLTTADYNYPTGNPTSVALWLMDPGIYINSNSVNVKMHLQDGSNSPCLYFVAPTMSSTSKIIIKTGNENGGAEQAFNKFTVRTDTGAKSNYVKLDAPVNNLTSTSDSSTLSAFQGKVLKDLIDAIVVPTKTSDLTNDGSDGTSTYVEANDLATVATTGAYTDITGTPTNVSDFTNDAGYQTGSQVSTAIATETTARQNADVNLQGQIDAIVASSDVKDIVGTKADLNNYDTTTLGDNDIIKVLADESQSGATTYYRWSVSGATFTLIGSEGPYYTKSQTDTLVNVKADASTTYTKTEVDTALSGKANTSDVPTVVQSPGTSTTDVMSQNAATRLIYPDYSSTVSKAIKIIGSNPSSVHSEEVTIGYGVSANAGRAAVGVGYQANNNGNRSVAIGNYARATADGSIAIGEGAYASTRGEMNIGTSTSASYGTSYGYNNTAYRLLTGLYDGQSDHDAATYGQVISYSAINGAGAPTTATEGKYVGQLYYDTTNEAMYFLKAIDTTTTPATYTWEALGGGGGSTTIQTTTDGTNYSDVLSLPLAGSNSLTFPYAYPIMSNGNVQEWGYIRPVIGPQSIISAYVGGYKHDGDEDLWSGKQETRLALYSDVHDATLTIQQNGATVDTFSANASTNKTVNIETPATFTTNEWNALWAQEGNKIWQHTVLA